MSEETESTEQERDRYKEMLMSVRERLDPMGERHERYMLFGVCDVLGLPVPEGDDS